MGLQLVPTSVTLTSNNVTALILHYFTLPHSIALKANYITVVEDRPIMFAEYRLPFLAKTDPLCSVVSLR